MSQVTVYVWVSLLKAQSPGHAALSIDGASYPSSGYVSFAPLQSGSISGAGNFYDRFHDDEHYKGRGVWIGTIIGLDTTKMLEQIKADVAAAPAYGPMNQCATTVRRYLKLGGGDAFASRWSRNSIPPISPDDVEDYAKSIVAGTRQSGSTGQTIRGKGSL